MAVVVVLGLEAGDLAAACKYAHEAVAVGGCERDLSFAAKATIDVIEASSAAPVPS